MFCSRGQVGAVVRWSPLGVSLLATAALTACGQDADGDLPCSKDDSCLDVRGILAPNERCRFEATLDSDFLESGTLDIQLESVYEAVLLVAGTFAESTTPGVQLTGAEVRLSNSREPLEEFTAALGGFVPGASGDRVGLVTAKAVLIPPAVGASLEGDLADRPGASRSLIVDVLVFGETSTGIELQSSPLRYVINVCSGCLVSYPASAITETSTGGRVCEGEPSEAAPCRQGQDEQVDCRHCAVTHPVCATPDLN